MSQDRRYLLSAISNWLAFAATLLVAFFLSPYLVRKLGDARYGIWVFVESIQAYFTLFDLGIAACVVRFVARFHTSKNQPELNRLVSCCMALFLGLGAIAFILGIAIAPVIGPMLGKAGMDQSEIVGFALLMLGNMALTLPMSLFPAMLDGLERFVAKSAIRTVILAIRTTAFIILVEHQPSLLGLGMILTVTSIVEHGALALLSFLYLPGLRFSYRLVDRATLKLVRGYSIDAFLAMVAGRVSVQSGAIIIGIFLSAPEITWFAIALRLVEFAKAMLRAATTTLTPAISVLETSGNLEGIRHVLLKATRWSLYIILPIHLGLILFGEQFLRIWMGSAEYARHCYPALMILSATLTLTVAQSVAGRILYGMGRLKVYARLTLLEAAVNLGLSLILVHRFRLEGVAWSAFIPNLFLCLFVIDYVCRALEVSRREYFVSAWWKPLAAGATPGVIWACGWTVSNWTGFGIALLAGLIPYAMIVMAMEGRPTRVQRKESVLLTRNRQTA